MREEIKAAQIISYTMETKARPTGSDSRKMEFERQLHSCTGVEGCRCKVEWVAPSMIGQ